MIASAAQSPFGPAQVRLFHGVGGVLRRQDVCCNTHAQPPGDSCAHQPRPASKQPGPLSGLRYLFEVRRRRPGRLHVYSAE
jgi:hypothetical protein